jgi:thioredoxin reductase
MHYMTDVAIIGAGPYGLSLAAHLAAKGVNLRIFGRPMQTWRTAMPKGMVLKSEGFASSLYDPHEEYTLGAYCAQHGLPYADIGLPVPLATFAAYGMSFQKKFVPMLDERIVANLERRPDGFSLRLDDGEIVTARRVVAASGIRQFAYIPPELERIRGPLLSHSADNHELSGYAGKNVLVIGGGAEGVELAGLLDEQGAAATVAARQSKIHYCDPPRPRTFMDKVKYPLSGLGTGWRSWIAVEAPMVFHRMPQGFRLLVVRKHLGPAPGWSCRERVESNVPILLGSTVQEARADGEKARVTFRMSGGPNREIVVDHVISATGYKVDLRRLGFLGQDLLHQIRSVENTPVLSPHFESSVPELYFVGATAANSFGPLLRFAYGAGFAAQRLSRHLVQSGRRAAQVPTPGLVPART